VSANRARSALRMVDAMEDFAIDDREKEGAVFEIKGVGML
jgi:hypothetical protein